MRKHAIVTMCVILSFCLRANFLPEISGVPGEGPGGGGAAPPYFETKLRPERPKKVFSDRLPPYLRVCMTGPPSPYLKIWIRHWK